MFLYCSTWRKFAQTLAVFHLKDTPAVQWGLFQHVCLFWEYYPLLASSGISVQKKKYHTILLTTAPPVGEDWDWTEEFCHCYFSIQSGFNHEQSNVCFCSVNTICVWLRMNYHLLEWFITYYTILYFFILQYNF